VVRIKSKRQKALFRRSEPLGSTELA